YSSGAIVPIGSPTRISRRDSDVCARGAGTCRPISQAALPTAALPMNSRRPIERMVISTSFRDAECEHGLRLIALPRAQNRRGEVRVIGRIGEVLRLQAERAAMLVNMAGFACDCAVEEIAGVELQPGLRRRDIERSAALRILELRGVTQPRVAIQDPVMVVALA